MSNPTVPNPASDTASFPQGQPSQVPLNEAQSSGKQVLHPLLSVVIPIYNGEEDVQPLMDCLRGQDYPRDRVEYLLIDNGSLDSTAELVSQQITQANSEGFRFRYAVESEIQSAYAARNTGIRLAQHELIVFTDADCRPQPQWLQELAQPFADEAVGLVVGEVEGAEGNNWLERYASYMDVLSQTHTLAHNFCPYGQTANLAVRRPAFAEVGVFRPYLTTGGDADMCWRIQQEGNWQLAFASKAIVEHCHRKSLEALRSQWLRYGRSNCYLNELHGIPLMGAVSRRSMAHGMAHWLVKSLPRTTWHWLKGKQPWIALIAPLLTLYCGWFRYQGQQQAEFPERARQIANLDGSITDPALAETAVSQKEREHPPKGNASMQVNAA